ncbi:hypothetical protein [Robertmurraya sp.]|uniref:hypothetical protein n=1 Tax=Robertmurraya sp. TaxID=2837525 RepID=UPI003703BEE3
MKQDRNKLMVAFPSCLRNDVQAVLNLIPQTSELTYTPDFSEVISCGETLYIPERIYYDEPSSTLIDTLPFNQQKILHTLYTRHHNGFVREAKVKEIIRFANEDIWIIPYLIKLVGEYVIEILQVFKENLYLIDFEKIKVFLSENAKFYQTIESRVISYWDCYYRHRYPKKEDYVGFDILSHFHA